MTDTKQLEENLLELGYQVKPGNSKGRQVSARYDLPMLRNYIQELITAAETAARLSELEMFKKIEVMDMSKAVTAHISRRYKRLQNQTGGSAE